MGIENYDFLLTEFSENFAHKRHFQNQRQALIGVYFTIIVAIPIILDKVTDEFYQGLLLLIVFIVGFLIFLCLIMNRKYSTVITRQINGIRNHFVSNSENPDIKSIFSEKYLNKEYPLYLNIKSDSFIIFCLVGILNSFAVSVGILYLLNFVFSPLIALVLSICIHVVALTRILR